MLYSINAISRQAIRLYSMDTKKNRSSSASDPGTLKGLLVGGAIATSPRKLVTGRSRV
jgi:hypothetical protein